MVPVLIASLGLVGYVFVGYPLLVGILAALRPKSVPTGPSELPTVSLLIFAYNEQDVIDDRLRNAAELDYPTDRLELIVVADGSDDKTAELAAAHSGVKVLHDPARAGKLAAIRRGVQASSGDLLVFSDANNAYNREALKALAAPFADPRVGVVTGSKVIDDGSGRSLDQAEGLYWRYESQIKRWESSLGCVTGVAGEILATRREAFVAPTAETLNEDFVQAMLAAIAGWRVIYAPSARSVERASATLADEMVRRSRLTTGRLQAVRMLLPTMLRRRPLLAWQMISHKGLRPVVPWALLIALLSNAALIGTGRAADGLFAAQVGFYLLAVIGRADARAGRRRAFSYLPYYFCAMNLASVRGLATHLRGGMSPAWARVARG